MKTYGEVVAVDNVDLTVEAGDVFGYLGPNGAGKTTSLRMLLGLIRPTSGSARLFGRDPLVDGARAMEGVAGFVEGPRFYPYMSGRRNLQLLADYDGGGARNRIDEVLDIVELRDRAKHKVGGYSHGMRQRLGIAASLLREPPDAPARRADDRARSGRHEGHARTRAPPRRRGHHGAALESPAHRGGGAVQPRRDHPQGPHPLRGRARRAAGDRERAVPAPCRRAGSRPARVPCPPGARGRAARR